MTGGGTTTPDAHDGRLQQGKIMAAMEPAHHITTWSFLVNTVFASELEPITCGEGHSILLLL